MNQDNLYIKIKETKLESLFCFGLGVYFLSQVYRPRQNILWLEDLQFVPANIHQQLQFRISVLGRLTSWANLPVVHIEYNSLT